MTVLCSKIKRDQREGGITCLPSFPWLLLSSYSAYASILYICVTNFFFGGGGPSLMVLSDWSGKQKCRRVFQIVLRKMQNRMMANLTDQETQRKWSFSKVKAIFSVCRQVGIYEPHKSEQRKKASSRQMIAV